MSPLKSSSRKKPKAGTDGGGDVSSSKVASTKRQSTPQSEEQISTNKKLKSFFASSSSTTGPTDVGTGTDLSSIGGDDLIVVDDEITPAEQNPLTGAAADSSASVMNLDHELSQQMNIETPPATQPSHVSQESNAPPIPASWLDESVSAVQGGRELCICGIESWSQTHRRKHGSL